MAKKTYQDKDRDLEALLRDIEVWFTGQGYQTQTNKTDGTWLLQAAKNETWRKAVGASRAFNVLIQGQPKDFSVELSTGEWASNLTAGGVAAVLTGGATLLVSGIAAGWSKKIEIDLWNFIDQKVMFGEKSKSVQELAVLKAQSSAEEKLKQLSDAYSQGFIDEIAYNAKKLELEGQMRSTQQDAKTEEKLMKLKSLLDAGILSQGEFEMKKSELMRESSSSELNAQVSKLNAAFAAGILTQEEYESKKSAIEKEAELTSRIKQLENARDAGIITREEFDKKKLALLV
ncbi:SHOCT domain-containing protein [Alkalinema sp. FACHB-956]|uniref:SHOCT domain-containing protein n=1 Tax=Alkalinema sp. FACHB-956 TaxID=2692768 RepID=UPI001687DC8A|nr:SHOCT domain-containing protein [Alkalinema sp. FACHB-956]MBD2326831.1 SHOCT domain-containing protein [Alkalinema sp. FACHB-956]